MAKENTTAAAEEPVSALISQNSPFEFDLDVAAKLGAKASGIEIVELPKPSDLVGVPTQVPIAITRGNEPKVLDLSHLFEKYRQHPARKEGTATAQTFEAFCELVNRHRTADSAIFADADWKKPSFTAVIDYHQAANGGRPPSAGTASIMPSRSRTSGRNGSR